MAYAIRDYESDGYHCWAVVHCKCDINDEADQLLSDIVAFVREGYGEADVLAALEPDDDVAFTFNLDAVKRAFRRGLPNPDVEKGKKPHLTNYRSESVEFVARRALAIAHKVSFPTHPQRGKTNVNQPILGFDGWGIFGSADRGFTLVLIQVKGTDEDKVPPREAEKLAAECVRIPTSVDEVCRALSVIVMNIETSPERLAILAMLESLSEADELPPVFVAPVIVRGHVPADAGDLQPVRDVAGQIEPSGVRGVSVGLGVDLTEFGKIVMTRARAA